MKTEQFFSLADLRFCVRSELPLDFGKDYAPFLCAPSSDVDAVFHISDDHCPVRGQKIHKGEVYSVFADNAVRYRLFEKGVGGFLLVSDENDKSVYTLYGDREELLAQQHALIRGYLGLEVPLLQNGAFLLHASLVRIRDKGILFSGPSHIGKSTQASLWETHKNAEILNGDRTLVRVTESGVRGYGSVFAGSSGIYKNESADLSAIVILSQSPENHIEPLSGSKAFFALFSQCLQNPWDPLFTERLTARIQDTISKVPVYHLSCRPDASAVELLDDTIFS